MPSPWTSTSTMWRSVVRPKLVSKKCTSGIEIWRRVTRSIFMPRLQQIDSFGVIAREAGGGEALRKRTLKLFGVGLLNLAGPGVVLAADLRDVGGVGNAFDRIRGDVRSSKLGMDARRIDPPLRVTTVGRQAAMQGAAGDAILIRRVAA